MNAQNSQNNQHKGGGLSWSQPARPSGENSFKPAGANKPTPQAAQKAPAAPASFASTNSGGTSTRKLVLLVAGGIVFGLLLGWAFFGADEASPEGGTAATSTQENTGGASSSTETETENGAETGNGSAGNNSFTIPPTQPAGLTVAVSQASVSGNTWIVVYESANGERGNALGAALFNDERSSGVIRLLRTTVAGQTYFVGHHRDDGDRKFSLEKDKPAVGANGEPVYAEFLAQ